MTYNFTDDGYIIDGVSTIAGNDTTYELTIELTPITEILLIIMALSFLNLMVSIKNSRGN